jgi:hypothetical protein
MSSERLDELDPTSAIFSALCNFWPRIFAFFALLWAGHLVGVNSFTAPEFLEALRIDGFGAFESSKALEIGWAPLSWLWTVVSACANPVFVLWLFILGGAFLNVWLSEEHWMHGLAIAAIGQPIHSFCAHWADQSRTALEAAIGLAVLGIWEALLIGGYWWLWRQRG